jgi:translation initiation factor IF-1
MHIPISRIAPLFVLLLSGCASQSEPTAPMSVPESALLTKSDDDDDDVKIKASGEGAVDLTVANGGFAAFYFDAKVRKNGKVSGSFRQSRVRNGLLVEFEGDVVCLTTDPTFPGRARIGGVVTKNNSTDPAFLTENHIVGAAVWFRVTDSERGTDATDASTTYGFKPTLVNTSEEYCALPFTGLPQWNPASIFPLEHGSIRVKG